MRNDGTPAPPPPPPSTVTFRPENTAPVAPWPHTLALVLLLLTTTFFGHPKAADTIANAPHLLRYGSSIVLEWLLLGSVIAGIYHRRVFFLQAFRNPRYTSAQMLGLGVAAYCMGFMAVLIMGLLLYVTHLFPARDPNIVLAMLPHTPLEFLMWFGVSLTAGICEELIFRGYLLQQLSAWTRRPIFSIVAAGLLFGSVHLYEGVGAILPLAALGIVYGLVVRRTGGDLRAVIVAHTLQDFLVALLVLLRPLAERYQAHH